MTEAFKKTNQKKTSTKAIFWMLFPVGLLVTSVSGWLTMVSVAVDDPGFAVEKDYYKKAASYDEQIAQRSENERLGYSLVLTEFTRAADGASVVIRLEAKNGAGELLSGKQVSVEAFANARAGDIRAITLTESKPGIYESTLTKVRPGIWEVRVRVEGEDGVFTKTFRPELGAALSFASPGKVEKEG